jgi:putative ABC transport system permease protein
MIKNYLKITFRYLLKSKSGTAINILGFTSGIVISLVILAYVNHEWSYDNFHQDANRIFRANLGLVIDGENEEVSMSPNILGPKMIEELPEVSSYVRTFNALNSTKIIKIGDKEFKERALFYADSTFFAVFDIDIIKSNSEDLLTKPHDVIISEEKAFQYFGTLDILGQSLIITGSIDRELIIQGIFKKFPTNSHFRPEIIANSLITGLNSDLVWGNSNYYTYVKLNDQANIEAVTRKVAEIVSRESEPWMKSMKVGFTFIPLIDIHLKSKADFEPSPVGDEKQLFSLLAIAIFVLTIACVNYINLSTSKSLERAREVGMRKMLGGTRAQLIIQFLTESFILTLISLIIILTIILYSEEYLSLVINKNLSFKNYLSPYYLIHILGGWILVSLFAGAYPAFIITGFRPAIVLKGSFKKSRGGIIARRVLVVFQFIISTSLIIATLIVYKQIGFLGNRKLGFDKEHVLAVNMLKIPEDATQNVLKNELMQHSNIEYVSYCSAYPSKNSGGQILNAEGMGEDDRILVWEWRSEQDILHALGVQLLSGKHFSTVVQEEEREYIINETAMKQIGWTHESALGKKMELSGVMGTCIGVAEDFHYTSLRDEVEPLIFNIQRNFRNNIIIRLNEGDVNESLNYIKQTWTKNMPGEVFDYEFLDSSFEALYDNEYRIGELFSVFSIFAVIIAGLGLFGLSSYEMQVRTKEVGIRKVLGSSGFKIFSLFFGGFTKLAIIGYVISLPVALYFMRSWLNGFAYKVNITFVEFIIAAGLAFMVLILSIGYHSIIASFKNPTESLRYE